MPLVIINCLLLNYASQAQTINNFSFESPVNIPLEIVANYGELRNNHFHNGLDIRTQGKIGLPLFTIDDGYISRIKIAPRSYGNVLYVTHKNNITSMYAHCTKFNDSIQNYIEAIQQKTQQFEQDIFLKENEIQVSKKQLIAYSGNTGSSQAPHLHFELHNSTNGNVLNPFLYGIAIPDAVAPIIKSIFLTPMDTQSKVNNLSSLKRIITLGKNGNYKPSKLEKYEVKGKLGIGIDVIDQHNKGGNADNIYGIKLFVDNELYCQIEHDEMPFDHNRYINSYCNYYYKKKHGGWIQQLFI